MASRKVRNPLLTVEDWWTVWFGMIILLAATGLGMLALSGSTSAKRVPKLGTWVSRPADAFQSAKKTRINLAADCTLAELADRISEKTPNATAEIVPGDGGVRLRVESSRTGDGATISITTLLEGGVEPGFVQESPDPGGLGARAWISRLFPEADVSVGKGSVTLTAQRTSGIVFPLIVTFVCLAALTGIGVSVMGRNAGRYVAAFLVIFLLAVLANVFASQASIKGLGLGYAAWALAIGLLISNTIGTPGWLLPGVRTEMYIKTGLVLLGGEILFGKILSLGPPGLLVAWVVTPVVLIFMWLFGTRVLKMVSKPLVMMIAAATSVCGVSAAIAVAGATRAKKEDLTLAVGMTLIFTVLMMIFMPMFVHAVGMGDVVGGAWMGGTIDSTGAVVAAGAFLGPEAETVAAVVKMIQNILIGIVGFLVACYWVTSVERDPGAPRPGFGEIWIRLPKFIVGFVAASVLFSFVLAPLFGSLFGGDGLGLVEKGVIKAVSNPLRGWFFCLAFVSIGLESDFRELGRKVEGGKPIALYIVGQTFNLVLTLLMAWLAFVLLFPESI